MYDIALYMTGVLGLMTFAAHVLFGLLILVFIVDRVFKKRLKFIESILKYLGKEAMFFIFFVSLLSVGMSLFYSEFVGFEPCFFCWWQRIFMYPMLLISAMALWKKDNGAYKYLFAMSLIGFLIGVYHYIVQMKEIFGADIGLIVPCSSEPGAVSCEAFYFLEFGYITMPMMSVTAFLSILVLLGLRKRKA